MVCLTVVLLAGIAGEPDLADRAAAAFAEGLQRREAGERSRASFRAAAAALEELRRQGARNPLLYRNLGNAYLLAGDLPRAILAYRLGLRLDPGDRTLRANLAAARAQVLVAQGSVLAPPPEEAPPVLSAGGRFLLAWALYATGCVCLVRWWMVRRVRWGLSGLLLIGLAATMGLPLLQGTPKDADRPVVVVVRNGVVLRRGNASAFPPRLDEPLNRGVEAILLHRRDGWLRIELTGGETGWIPEGDAVVEEEVGAEG